MHLKFVGCLHVSRVPVCLRSLAAVCACEIPVDVILQITLAGDRAKLRNTNQHIYKSDCFGSTIQTTLHTRFWVLLHAATACLSSLAGDRAKWRNANQHIYKSDWFGSTI